MNRYFLSHGQCLVLAGFHNLTFTLALVVDATQVKDAVYDHAMQFLLICGANLLAVASHGIQRDEKVTTYNILLSIVESDDVGVIVVLQVLTVYLKDLFIIAENVGNISNLLAI